MNSLSTVPTASRSILIVDDDDAVRSVIEVCLAGAGYRVSSAAGREAVLQLLTTETFDLIITDVIMPDFDGTEVVVAARGHQPKAAVLAMSGGGPHMTADFCLKMARKLGVGTPLVKPFHLNDLIAAVETALTLQASAEAPLANTSCS